MQITTYQIQGRVPVTVLQPHGDLDTNSHYELIARGQEIGSAGVDLADVRYMSSSGLLALHSIARMLQSKGSSDPEAGWSVFHAIEHDLRKGIHAHFKLLNPQPEVDRVLDMVGYKQIFEVYTDLQAAVASF